MYISRAARFRSNLSGPCILVLCASTGRTFGAPPEPLSSAIARRANVERAEIEYLVIAEDIHRQHFTERLAGSDQIMIQRGDDEGVIYRDRSGNPLPIDTGVEYNLTSANDRWRMSGGDIQPDYRTDGRIHPVHVHCLGLTWDTPLFRPDAIVPAVEDIGGSADSGWQVVTEGEFKIVRRQTARGRFSWWFSGEDACPTRVLLEHEGGHWEEARARLKRYGEILFPEVVEYYRSAFKSGREPYQIIIVHSARFDEPDLPRKLTPFDIEVDVGMHVVVYDKDGKPKESRQWDGNKLVTLEEFERRRKAGELEDGPILLANRSRLVKIAADRAAAASSQPAGEAPNGDAPSAANRPAKRRSYSPETPWEAYTRRFIVRFRLDDEQTQKALLVLKECEDNAATYLAAHQAGIDVVDRAMADLAKLPLCEQVSKRDQLQSKREKLLKPLDDIFQDRLKPQLDKIPTRAQRRVADADEDKNDIDHREKAVPAAMSQPSNP